MSQDAKYEITIIQRDFQGQTADDFHATIKRLSDGVELISIAPWRWLLKWKVRPKALDRAFRYHDKRQAKLAEVEKIRR